MQRIAILGSTGSIGINTLDIIRRFPAKFRVAALSTNANTGILYRQIKEFHPSYVCVNDFRAADKLKSGLKFKTRIFIGQDGLTQMIRYGQIDRVVLAISGSQALIPLLAAIDAGLDIALANKEALVMAGPIIMQRAKNKGTKIIPIDSEQSAIWQCLNSQGKDKIKNVYLTASGGPFRERCQKDFRDIRLREVLRHPRWKMGKKITVDSATLMNKGLEILETMFLFAVGLDKIKVVIHPEAVIHSMVEFIDGVIIAQLSATDMRIPIQYALSYPARFPGPAAGGIDFYKLKKFNFEKPDLKKFPCLNLALKAARAGGTMPCVLNAANEVAVSEFLKKRINFISIPKVIGDVLSRHRNNPRPGLEDILDADSWARRKAYQAVGR